MIRCTEFFFYKLDSFDSVPRLKFCGYILFFTVWFTNISSIFFVEFQAKMFWNVSSFDCGRILRLFTEFFFLLLKLIFSRFTGFCLQVRPQRRAVPCLFFFLTFSFLLLFFFAGWNIERLIMAGFIAAIFGGARKKTFSKKKLGKDYVARFFNWVVSAEM